MQKLFYLICLVILSIAVSAQTNIYTEDFTGQNGKGVVGGSSLVFDTSGVSWSIQPVASGLTASTDWFQVQNELFEGRDIDADQVWVSDTIDISTYSNISLSLDASESGTMESADYLNVEFSTDGGQNYTLITDYNGKGDATHTLIDDFTSETITQSISNGTDLIIRISMYNNSSSEYIRFDNISVTGFIAGSLTASISSTIDASCNGDNDGSISVLGSNGTTPYTYLWSNGATTSTASSLSAGTYTVTLTDAVGSTATTSGAISEPSALNLSLSIDQNVNCNGGNDGVISTTLSGGTAPYTYVWSNGMSASSISNLSSGAYTLTVIDANGCDSVSSVTISEPDALMIMSNMITNASCGQNNGSASLKATGGTGQLTFDWSTGLSEVVSSKVAFQSFEGNSSDTWNYSINPSRYNVSGDVWDSISSLSSITPNDQSLFWGMQDLDNTNGGGSFYHTMTFDAIDVTSVNNGSVNFDYYTIGFDSSDELEYEVVFDDDTVWNANGTALNKNTGSWTTVSVPIPMNTQYVRLRIQATQNGGSDYAAIDNVSISQIIDTSYSQLSNVSAGTYTVTVTDENSCTASNSITISTDPCNNLVSGLRTFFIQDTAASLIWDTVAGAISYKVVIREASSPSWTNRYFKRSQQGRLDLDNLTPNTKYFWSVMYRDNTGWSTLPKATTFFTLSSSCEDLANLRTVRIRHDRARLEWDSVGGGSKTYRIRYKEQGTSNWLRIGSKSDKRFVWITGLKPNTTYEWQAKNVCAFNSSGTRWSPVVTFQSLPAINSTPMSREKMEEISPASTLSVFPNPAQHSLNIDGITERTEIMVLDQVGRIVLRKYIVPNGILNIENLNNGIYFIKALNESEKIVKFIKH